MLGLDRGIAAGFYRRNERIGMPIVTVPGRRRQLRQEPTISVVLQGRTWVLAQHRSGGTSGLKVNWVGSHRSSYARDVLHYTVTLVMLVCATTGQNRPDLRSCRGRE